jgi:hypothetical protein
LMATDPQLELQSRNMVRYVMQYRRTAPELHELR